MWLNVWEKQKSVLPRTLNLSTGGSFRQYRWANSQFPARLPSQSGERRSLILTCIVSYVSRHHRHANTDLGVPFDRTPRRAERNHGRQVSRGRSHHIDIRGRPIESGRGSGAHRGHGGVSAGQRFERSGFWRAVYQKRKRRNYGDHMGGGVGFSRRTCHDNVLGRRMVLQTPCNQVYIVEIAVPGFGNHGERPRVSDIAFLHYSRTRGVKGVEDVVRPDMKAEYP